MKKNILLLVLVFSLINILAIGQNKELNLEEIFKERKFSTKYFGPIRWLENGSEYTTLESSADAKGSDIIKYNPKTGERIIIVSARDLVPNGESKALSIRDYSWSDDSKKLLIFTNTKRVWRYHTRGDYWVLDLQTGNLQQIGKELKTSTLMFAKFSPDALKVAFVSEQNIYMEELATQKMIAITIDGGGHIINGTFDWAMEEELSLRDGFRWSPDGESIAYWQLNSEGIGTFNMINNIDSIYPTFVPVLYPKVGTTVSSSKVGVIDIKTLKTKWMNIPGDDRDHYIARMDWAHSSQEIIIQQLNRAQNTNKVFLGDKESGDVQLIHTEKVNTWLDVYDDLTWFDDGKYFSWRSDKTDWLHLYKVSRDGKEMKQITKGDFEIVNLLSMNKKDGWAYYIASPNNPLERYLYRSKLNGKGKPELLSPVEQKGHHSYSLSADCEFAVHTFSNANTPPIIEMISLPNHKVLQVLEDNSELKETLTQYDIPKKEFFKLEIEEGVELDAWVMKPTDFDSTKKYPVFFFVYGEPAGSTVQNQYKVNMWDAYIAQQGYIVISVDNRGTNVPKGREWRKSIYKQIGILATHDQAAAAKIIMEWDFVDKERIGIWGWSGGGSMTLNCMFKYPKIYKTGIAVAFVSHQKVYNAIYQERYMDHPDNNPKGYEEGSPINFAKNLEGNLMLIHGSGDDNVHYQSCELLIDELIKHNKYFNMMDYPMRSHGIYERENTSLHLYMTMEKYLKANLPAGGK